MRQENGLRVYFQAAEPLEYTFDTLLTEPAVFKLITSAPTGNVKVIFANGVTKTIDCERLDGMNAQVIKVFDADTDIAITDFDLFR